MSEHPNPFEAAIAALEARRAQVNAEIDADIAKLKEIGERIGGTVSTTAAVGGPTKIEKDTFYSMTLPEAAKKFLAMGVRKPQSTNSIIDALEKGGLKRTTYASMYASLKRRNGEVGDIVNVNGDWGLAEWYGAKPKPKKQRSNNNDKEAEKEPEPEDPAASVDLTTELGVEDPGEVEVRKVKRLP